MSDREAEIAASLKRLAKATEEIARLMRTTGEHAARAGKTFAGINWEDYPSAPYDN